MASNPFVPIHNCIKISLENDYFKEKLILYYKENKKLKEQIGRLTEEFNDLKVSKLNPKIAKVENSCQTYMPEKHDKVNEATIKTKCSVLKIHNKKRCSSKNFRNKQMQTDEVEQFSSNKIISPTPTPCLDKNIYNNQNKKSYIKLCQLQHNLLKKYEDEVNLNAVKQELINKMKIEIDQLEEKCKLHENEISLLQIQIENMQHLEARQKSLLLDLENYKTKYEKYKKSLKYFDDDFFSEIENLKSRHDETIRLNKYYEYLLFRGDRENLILKNIDTKKNKTSRVKFTISSPEESYSQSIFDKSLD